MHVPRLVSARVVSAGVAVACLLSPATSRAIGTPEHDAVGSPLSMQLSCERRVVQAIGAVCSNDWDLLASALDPATLSAIETTGRRVMQLDRTGVLRFIADTQHPARARRTIRVEPIQGSPTRFIVKLTAPFTYIDEPMVGDLTPCPDKPVELCVQLVQGGDGEWRLKLTYDLYDLIYLLQ